MKLYLNNNKMVYVGKIKNLKQRLPVPLNKKITVCIFLKMNLQNQSVPRVG